MMETQKIENLLQTSFEANEQQREKSPELEAAYDSNTDRFEVAIRYIRDMEAILNEYPEVEREFLIGNYAILKGKKEDLLRIATRDEVLYMEAAKRLFFSWEKEVYAQQTEGVSGLTSICLTREFPGEEDEMIGNGVYTAYLDTGIDYRHPEFIDAEGKSRIAYLWDQTREDGFYTKAQIDEALSYPVAEGERIVPQKDLSGHGTHVAAIGSGNSGVAPGSELIVVKLGTPAGGGAKTTQLMRAVNRCVNLAVENKRPLALNISYGTNYGAHNEYGVLEQFLTDAVLYGRNVFVAGAGNEGVGKSHFQVPLTEIRERKQEFDDAFEISFAVGVYQQGFSLQIWKEFNAPLRFYILPAGSNQAVELINRLETVTYTFPGMEALIYYGQPSPFSPYQEIYLDFIPNDSYLPQGIWKIYVEYIGEEIQGDIPMTNGREDRTVSLVDFWLPVSETLSPQTGFLRPSPEKTLTIPSTAAGVITVGAYDQRLNQIAPFSGRGYTWGTNQVKPDIVAPGVNIVSASPGGGYTMRSGSSMAAPFVTGAAALLMEWGIIRRRDLYLYGEKAKAYFIRGAKQLPATMEYPNSMIGWGALCIRNSIFG